MEYVLYQLATAAQWTLFLAVIASAASIVEKSDKYAKTSLFVFMLAGLIGVGTLIYLPSEEGSMVDGALSRIAQLKVLSLPVSGITLTGLLSILFQKRNKTVYKICYTVTFLIGVIMFFQYYKFLHAKM